MFTYANNYSPLLGGGNLGFPASNGTLHFTIAESSETTSNEGNLPSPIVPYEDFEFRLPASTMGAYSTAAVSTDTRPCAKVGT